MTEAKAQEPLGYSVHGAYREGHFEKRWFCTCPLGRDHIYGKVARLADQILELLTNKPRGGGGEMSKKKCCEWHDHLPEIYQYELVKILDPTNPITALIHTMIGDSPL